MKKLIKGQFWVLLVGTVFAWANFVYELVLWIGGKMNPIACNPLVKSGTPNPFLTPCFYGALMFLAAFVLSWLIKKRSDKV